MSQLPSARHFLRQICGVVCLATGVYTVAAHALDLAIPAQALPDALRKFAGDSDLQLIYESSLAQSRSSPGAPAGLSDEQTLVHLLTGTGLQFKFINERTVLISTAPSVVSRHSRLVTSRQVASDPAVLEEVQVTAERRVADAQKTSISLTTLSGELLQRESRMDLRSVLMMVPGLVMQGDIGRYNVALRGIGTNTPPNAAETTVALNTDGVYSDIQINPASNYFDVDRVEVLRGPQGTLYGRNAAAGAVNLITNDPDSDFAASAQTEVGNYQLLHLEGMLNVPLQEGLAARLAVNSVKHDGYLSNDQNDQDSRAARLKLAYETDTTRLLVGASAERNAGSVGSVAAFHEQPVDAWVNHDSVPNSSVAASQLVYAQLDWSFTQANLTVLPSYQYRKTRNAFYSSGNRFNGTNNASRQVSLEARLASPDTSAIKWVAGMFTYDADGTVTLPSGPSAYRVSSVALFGQTIVPLTTSLRGIAGLRLTSDWKTRKRAFFKFQDDWQNLDFKLGVELDVASQSLVYLTLSSGYRPGGVYESSPGTFHTYEPEHLLSGELGIKNQLFSDVLQLNANVFKYDYRDFQATSVRLTNGVQVSDYQNAPGAHLLGAETELKWIPVPHHRVVASVSYLNAHFKNGFVNNGIDYSGSTMENAPRWSGAARYEYQRDVADGALSSSIEVISKTDYFLAYSRAYYSHQPAFTQVNLATEYSFAENAWQLSGWIRNVGNYAVRTSYITTPTSGDYLAVSPPRTFGLGVTARF